MILLELYRKMILIRVFEEKVLKLFSEGFLSGTTHACIGQEANAVGFISHLRKDDIILSNHRCHGHYIAFTDDIEGLMAELMGKKSGICSGKGGSQHLCNSNFYTNGIQGGMVPCGVGMALAKKKMETGNIVVVFIGDGTLGQGIVYESMNIASLWRLPIVFVLENNYYAQSTPSHLQISGNIIDRPRAFDIETLELSTNDMEIIYNESGKIINDVRTYERPFFLILNTYRLCPHSKGDDYRDVAEIEEWRKKDPIKLIKRKLPTRVFTEIEKQCLERVEKAVEFAKKSETLDSQTLREYF